MRKAEDSHPHQERGLHRALRLARHLDPHPVARRLVDHVEDNRVRHPLLVFSEVLHEELHEEQVDVDRPVRPSVPREGDDRLRREQTTGTALSAEPQDVRHVVDDSLRHAGLGHRILQHLRLLVVVPPVQLHRRLRRQLSALHEVPRDTTRREPVREPKSDRARSLRRRHGHRSGLRRLGYDTLAFLIELKRRCQRRRSPGPRRKQQAVAEKVILVRLLLCLRLSRISRRNRRLTIGARAKPATILPRIRRCSCSRRPGMSARGMQLSKRPAAAAADRNRSPAAAAADRTNGRRRGPGSARRYGTTPPPRGFVKDRWSAAAQHAIAHFSCCRSSRFGVAPPLRQVAAEPRTRHVRHVWSLSCSSSSSSSSRRSSSPGWSGSTKRMPDCPATR